MEYANLVQIGWGMLGGFVVVLVFYGLLSLKFFRLQMQLGAIKESLVSIKNTDKATRRWAKEASLEQDLQAFAANKNVHSERFANDPLNY